MAARVGEGRSGRSFLDLPSLTGRRLLSLGIREVREVRGYPRISSLPRVPSLPREGGKGGRYDPGDMDVDVLDPGSREGREGREVDMIRETWM